MKDYLNEKIESTVFLAELKNTFKKYDYSLFDFYSPESVKKSELNDLVLNFSSTVLSQVNKHDNSIYYIIRRESLINERELSYKLCFELKKKDNYIYENKDFENFSHINVSFENISGEVSFSISGASYCNLFEDKGIELSYTLSEKNNIVSVKSLLSDDNIEFNFLNDSKKIICNHIQTEDYTTVNYAENHQDIDYDNNPEEHEDFQKNFYSFFNLSKSINNESIKSLYPILLDLFFEKGTLSEENIDFVKILYDVDLSSLKNVLTIDNKNSQTLKI